MNNNNFNNDVNKSGNFDLMKSRFKAKHLKNYFK